MKPHNIWQFYQSLKNRGMSLTKLGVELRTTHAHLSQVINGTRGAHTRKHIARYLTREETDLLQWEEQGEFVPRETMFHPEQGEALTHGGEDNLQTNKS